ncbi:hypothetical protein GGG16DRAFT_56161 [Schizophyllum commune]
MARNCALSESEKAAKKAARLDTLRRRDKLGLAIVTRKRRARESFVAQQLTSSLPVTPDRLSARVREQGGAKKLVFSPTGSTESASRRADADYSPIKTITIRVYDADGSTSTYKTPSKFSKGDTRPKPDQLHDSFVSDDGVLRCIITGQSNKNGTVQFAHVVDRSLERDLLRQLEKLAGMRRETMSLDTRTNIIPLCVEIHRPLDLGHIIILPCMAVLSDLLNLLTEKKLPSWVENQHPRRNKARYIHHEDCWERGTEIEVHIVPVSTWSEDSGIRCISRREDGTVVRKYYEHPFVDSNGQPEIPTTKVKVAPIFLAFKAYISIAKKGAGKPPAYVADEIRTLKRIGELIRGDLTIDRVATVAVEP